MTDEPGWLRLQEPSPFDARPPSLIARAVVACLATLALSAPAALAAPADGERTPLNLDSGESTTQAAERRRRHRPHDRRPRRRARRHLRPVLGPQAGQGVAGGPGRPAAASTSVASLPLGPNRSVHLVRVGDELVLLGAAEKGVTPIRTYTEDEARAVGLLADEDVLQLPAPQGATATAATAERAAGRRLALDTLSARTVRR